ncbi:MAG: prepilin-type N-terminal cleavage/methylation domain-containing protein [Thermodesulfovibrionales bacterium]
MQNRGLNQKGVTLVEVLISLVILLIVFMGLIQASILSINHNLRNAMRDEAVRIASEYMSMARSTANIDKIAGAQSAVNLCPAVFTAAAPLSTTINRGIRNINQQFIVTTTGCYTDATYSIAEATVTVNYIYPEQPTADLLDPNKRQTTSANSRVKRRL